MKHVASCSFGKDSLATVILAREHGEPLDEVVYCEVMFDQDVSGEVPEHRDFIYNVAIPKLKSWGDQDGRPSERKDLCVQLHARHSVRATRRPSEILPAVWALLYSAGL